MAKQFQRNAVAISGGFTVRSYSPYPLYERREVIQFEGSFPQFITEKEAERLEVFLFRWLATAKEHRAAEEAYAEG